MNILIFLFTFTILFFLYLTHGKLFFTWITKHQMFTFKKMILSISWLVKAARILYILLVFYYFLSFRSVDILYGWMWFYLSLQYDEYKRMRKILFNLPWKSWWIQYYRWDLTNVHDIKKRRIFVKLKINSNDKYFVKRKCFIYFQQGHVSLDKIKL